MTALLPGPLYHLRQPHERNQAVSEAARVLKSRGIVAAAGINRLTFLRDMFRSPEPFSSAFFGTEFVNARETFEQTLHEGSFIADFLATGNLDPQHAPPIGYAHLTTLAEFRQLLTADFQELVLVGVESFTAPWQDGFRSKPPKEASRWLDIVEASGTTPEGLAHSDHFLFIGQKRT